ncbi:MAG: PfkB family carbohydrate kinase [Peptoniphilus sp.]|nr:PfkB family carbohydrate kinase [Peptoniphilus sp.]MDY3117990.1 PfkB family carbohydrate kinase [Peptoniphilus sp.]
MILLVDTNPILEQRLQGDSFPKGAISRAETKQTKAAGYGAHMASLVRNMNEEARLMAFLGDYAGERYEKLLSQVGVDVIVKNIRDETQERLILEEKYKTSTIETREPRLTREDMVGFYDRFLNEVSGTDVVVIAKGSRRDAPEEMKLPLVRYARKKSKPVIILATEEDDVEETREARPFGVVVDRDVLARRMKRPIHFLGDIVKAVEQLYGNEIPLILITGSERGSVLCAWGTYFYAKNEVVDEHFDAHYAAVALAAGIVRKYDAPMILKLAQAAAATVGETDFGTLKGRMNTIEIQQMEV